MARPKHRIHPSATYFITTDTWQRRSLFRNTAVASIVEEAIFRYRDQGRYLVHHYVVMPDHIHVILTPGTSSTLERCVQLIKGGSAREIGKRPGMRFPVWHAGFTEHQIRDQRDYDSHATYIDQNPVKAGLAESPENYDHGSAAAKYILDPWPLASGAKAPDSERSRSAGLKPRPSECGGQHSPTSGLKPGPSERRDEQSITGGLKPYPDKASGGIDGRPGRELVWKA
jgi:REP-associated tyrosine transposase